MTITGQLLWLCLLLFCLIIEDFCFNVQWRNQSIDLQCRSFFWILFGAWYWKEFWNTQCLFYCNLNRSFMSLLDRIFLIGTIFILNLLLCFWPGMCSIIPFQRYRLVLCNIKEQSEFSTIANISIDCIIKIFSDLFLYRILLFTLQYRGVTFYVTGRINLFKT